MILENPVLPFFEWIGPATGQWFLSVGILFGVALVIGFILCAIRYGFAGVMRPFAQAIERGVVNLTSFSFSRTWAIARLTMKESFRRRVLLVFALFMVILLLAGLFLDPNSEDPAKLFLTVVLSGTMILVLLLALFLSSFSLPTDFKNKTIYSVVTKPVRSSELVVGRIVGVGIIGTIMLLLMAVASYFFVFNGLKHTHILTEKEELTAVAVDTEGGTSDDPKRVLFYGNTRQANGHKHQVSVLADGTIQCEFVNGHTHKITAEKVGDQTRYNVGVEQGTLQARVPIYGKLGFRGGDGLDTDKGINVGDEWEYRSYVGGNTRLTDSVNEEAAIFLFEGISESAFPKSKSSFEAGLPIEMTLGVFRTHKADIEKGVSASLAVRNPKTGLKVEVLTFHTEEFITKSIPIPWTFEGTPQVTQRRGRTKDTGEFFAVPSDQTLREQRDNPEFTQRRTFDLMKDFVADGKMEIWLQCIDNGQYIGVAQADLYLRADDGSVVLNFVKGFYGIWMRMIIVTAFGVLFSTFLSGPVAMISTVGVLVAGFSKGFMMEIGLNKVLGGGPVESLYRLLIQQNMVVDLPTNFSTTFIKSVDKVYGLFMQLCGQAIPPLSDYNVYDTALVYGFNITGAWLLNHTVMTFAYAFPLFIVAYLILSNREVAK